MAEVFAYRAGALPILLSIPHGGRAIPADIAAAMSDAGRAVADTDWHLDRLWDFANLRGCHVLEARYSRHVVDLNRDPDGKPLYPGAENTELVPLTGFGREPLWRIPPDATEIERRKRLYWRPYHDQLVAVLAAIKAAHGIAMLFEAHSIRGRVPRLFEGELPDFNLGSADGRSCDPALAQRMLNVCRAVPGYSAVLDGRFKGGYITRRYGRPAEHVHAVQLELAQRVYMEEAPPWTYSPRKADLPRHGLMALIDTLADYARAFMYSASAAR
ncbi:MAG: N-formylglutamate deformylase [Alphaproteobacteria bacterium]|nr:N-formylglutamate deformylase [Alphaproteobacteria bacterium]